MKSCSFIVPQLQPAMGAKDVYEISLPPPAPYDLFIRHEERRVYNRAGETRIRISSKPEMVYYHPLRSCTGLDEGDVEAGRLVVSREVHRLLTKVHRRHLFKEFKLELD